jgi:hypothetical protein
MPAAFDNPWVFALARALGILFKRFYCIVFCFFVELARPSHSRKYTQTRANTHNNPHKAVLIAMLRVRASLRRMCLACLRSRAQSKCNASLRMSPHVCALQCCACRCACVCGVCCACLRSRARAQTRARARKHAQICAKTRKHAHAQTCEHAPTHMQ